MPLTPPRPWRRLLSLVFVGILVVAPPAHPDTGDVAHDAGLQWGLDAIGVEQAWETARGDGVVVAVVDSGVALDHEDLRGQLVEGVACQNTGGDPAVCAGRPDDDDGHGTHVAGIVAAATGNDLGIAGVAPGARIMPIKVLFRSCPTCESTGNAEDVSAAIRWAADHGADVINLSLGSTTSAVFGPSFAAAVDHAWSLGAIPVVAAGNDYVLTADLGSAPAIVVSATARDDAAPAYTNGVGNARWAVAAPGGDGDDTPTTCAQNGSPRGILSTFWAPDDPNGAYACLSGTSMAAPHVSGAVAVLRSAGLQPEDAVRVLLSTAVDLGPPGPDATFGTGRIDLAAAIADVTGSPAPAVPEQVDPASATTDPSLDGGLDLGAPQLFVETSPSEVPPWLVALAAASILCTAATTVALQLRLRSP